MSASAPRAFTLLSAADSHPASRELPVEAPVELRLNGHPLGMMMLTPSDLEDFACGFCLSEGLVPHAEAIVEIQVRQGENAW